MSCVNLLHRLVAVAGEAGEQVWFDTQLLENRELSGIEYPQGTRAGYQVPAYLFERFGRRIHVGRINIHAGSFTVSIADGISARCCKLFHRRYGYGWQPALAPPPEGAGFRRGRL